MKQEIKNFTCSNGYQIPCIGYGTWQTPDGETARKAVKTAIESGYRHIDTAAAYGNEVSVGKGIAEGMKTVDIQRSELFVTSKLWNTERGYDKTIAAFEKTLSDLKLDYLDLYLIHWPASAHQFEKWDEINLETWRAMTDLYKEGRIKAIGVSNFWPHHLKSLLETEVKPMVNQIEFHPGMMQSETVKFCREHQILLEAWSPIGSGRVLTDKNMKVLAEKYNRSVAQICVRWCLQNEVIPLPKSVTESRIIENRSVFDFELSEGDMKYINSMPEFAESGLHPDKIDF